MTHLGSEGPRRTSRPAVRISVIARLNTRGPTLLKRVAFVRRRHLFIQIRLRRATQSNLVPCGNDVSFEDRSSERPKLGYKRAKVKFKEIVDCGEGANGGVGG